MGSTCSLVVDVPGEEVFAPKFATFPSSLTVDRGSAASFEADLGSAPTSVVWMKDGKEVKEQPMKHRITSKGTKATLDILECSTADAGQYALIVSNKKGPVLLSHTLSSTTAGFMTELGLTGENCELL